MPPFLRKRGIDVQHLAEAMSDMQIDDVRRVLVVGAGRMGAEVGLQCALFGYQTVLYDIAADKFPAALRQQTSLLDELVGLGRLSTSDAEATLGRIATTTDLESAAVEADVVSESAPEKLRVKRELFARLDELCPPRTVFTTNTSYLLPSRIAPATGRPEKFAALHFHPKVWLSNVVDVMPHPGTSQETIDLLSEFAVRIGQMPIVCRKENHGYVFNHMLLPVLRSAVTLAERGVASVEDIDRAWMGVMLTGIGPFGLLDNIGLDTARDVIAFWATILRDPEVKQAAEFLQKLIDEGRLGMKTGRGFYEYPNPAFTRPEFFPVPTNIAGEGLIPALRHTESRESKAESRKPEGLDRAPADVEQSRESAMAPDRMTRLLMRTVPAPLNEKLGHRVRLHGPALIVGENPTAEALKRRLEALGGHVASLPLSGSLDESLDWFDRTWNRQPFPHLFLMTARDREAATRFDHAHANERYQRGVLLPYYVCQRWFAGVGRVKMPEKSTLVAATALGGDFGVSSGVDAAEGGGMCGLLKTLFVEAAARNALGPQIKVVDAALHDPPETVADQVLKELALAQASVVTATTDELHRRFADVEIGYRRGMRHAVRVVETPLGQIDEPRIPPNSVWVVTGGARGITAYVARELGRRFGVKLNLIGTTPLPKADYTQINADELQDLNARVVEEAAAAGEHPQAAWSRVTKGIEVQKSLFGLKQAGVRATYHACDVGDAAGLSRVLERVRCDDGPIEGIIHGAGYEVTARIEDKTRETVERTLAPKWYGMTALMELTRNDPLRYFIAFGSAAGRFGSFGQTDYAMANELLAKQIDWFRARRPECLSVAFHWPGWEEVGMAARPASRRSLEKSRHQLMAPEEGVRHLLRELAAGAPAGEVVIVATSQLPAELFAKS